MFVNIQDAIKARKAGEEKYVQPIVERVEKQKACREVASMGYFVI